MSAPEKIPVKYSEDLAQFAELRPVVRQVMTLGELVGLVLTSTGKHPRRIRAHLRSGTCVYNIYRYWWDSFEIDDATLNAVLAAFPDPDPTRPFRGGDCQWAKFYDARQPVPHSLTLEKQEAARRRWFRPQSFWNFLMDFADRQQPVYQDYSYYHRADLYRAALSGVDRARLRHESRRLAPRSVQQRLTRPDDWVWLELGCPRSAERAVEG